MEAASAITTPTVETASAKASTAAATVTSAMLGESRAGRAHEGKGSETCQKSFQQGGISHFNFLHLKNFPAAREGNLHVPSLG